MESTALPAPTKGSGAGQPLMEAFWSLSSEDDALRRRAAAALVRFIQRAQAEFEEQSATSGLADATADTACNDLAYAAKRLVRGLASSRAASRQGYALALTELLQTFPALRSGDIADAISALAQTSGKGGSSKSEQRESLLGKVFGALVLVRSGRLAPAGEPGAADAAVGAVAVQLIGELYAAAARKSWISGAAFEAVAAIAAAVGPGTWTAHVAAAVLPRFPPDTRDWGAEHLALALALEELTEAWFPGQELAVPPPVTALRAALDPAALRPYHLASDRRGADAEDDEGSGAGQGAEEDDRWASGNAPLAKAVLASSAAYPQLHPVWGRLLQRYAAGAFGSGSDADRGVDAFSELWRVYIDEVLLPGGPERKATAMALLARVAIAAPGHAAVLPAVLSRHLVRSLVRNLGSKRRVLHAPAKAAIGALLAACRGRSAESSAAMMSLLVRGHPNFDKVTGTGTVAALLAELDDGALAAHLAAVREDFLRPAADGVVYADAASIATGKTGASGDARAFGGDNKSAGRPDGGSVRSGKSEGGGSDDDDDVEGGSDDEEAAAARLRRFSAVDMRRLWALDTLVGAVRNAGVPSLRHPAAIAQLIAFIAMHAFGDASVPAAVLEAAAAEEAAAAAAPAAVPTPSVKASGKRARAAAPPPNPHVAALRALVRVVAVGGSASSSLAEGASLLVADPPLSEPLREEIRARLLTLLHELPKTQLVGGGAGASGRGRQARPPPPSQQQQKATQGGAPAPVAAAAAPVPPRAPAWAGCDADRAGAALQMQLDLATLVQDVWAAGAAAAAASAEPAAGLPEGGGLVVTAFPAADQLAVAAARDDEEDDDEEEDSDEEEEEDEEDDADGGEGPAGGAPSRRPALVPADVRTAALAAAASLRTVAAAVFQRALSPAVTAGCGGRQRVVEAARHLLAYGALLSHGALVLLLDPADAGVAAAVADSVACAPVLLADALARARAALAAAAAAAAAAPSAALATPGKKKKGGAPAPPLLAASAASDVAAAAAAAQAAADALPGLAAPFSGGSGESPAEALLVLVDAALALLSNAGATLREVVKTALRPLFCYATPAVAQAILSVVTAARPDGPDGEGDDEDGGAAAEGVDGDSDAESVTLGADALLEPFTGGAAASSAAAAADGSDRDSDASGGDDDAKTAESGEDEMARYDRMLGGMLRMRKHARVAATQHRRSALHFKFRALALLDAAVSGLSHADAGTPGDSSEPASLSLLLFPVPMLRAARLLAARARGQAPGAESNAGDSAALLARLLALLLRVTKQRVPALLQVGGAGGSEAAGSSSGSSVSAAVVAGFAEVLLIAQRAPTSGISDAAAAVSSMLLRALRVGAAVGGGAAASAGGNLAAQVAPAFLDPVVEGYSRLLEVHFTHRRSLVGAAFMRAAVAGAPAIAARLLPVLAGLVAGGSIPKVFRLQEAVQLLGLMLRAAAAPWAASVVCGPAPAAAAAAPTPRKKRAGAPAAPQASAAPPTVASALSGGVPALLGAVASVVSAAAAGRSDDAATPASAAVLPLKQVKDAVALVPQLAKAGLLLQGGAEADAVFAALAALQSRSGGRHGLAQQISRCFELAGREAPADVEEEEEVAAAAGDSAEVPLVEGEGGQAAVAEAVPPVEPVEVALVTEDAAPRKRKKAKVQAASA